MPSYMKGEPVWISKKKQVAEPGIWEAKDGKGYIAEVSWTDPHTGKRVREMKRTNRLDLARQWRQTRKADALRGEITRQKKKDVVLFKNFADDYFNAWSINRKDSTVATEKNRIEGTLKRYFGRKTLHTITRRDIETYLRKRQEGPIQGVADKGNYKRGKGISQATANRELARLKSMFKYAVSWGLIDDNPVLGIQQEKEVVREADYLNADEVRRFLAASEDRYRPIFVAAVYTGIRFSKIMDLEWRDILIRWDRIKVRDPKNNEDRYVPMNRAVKEALLEIQPEGMSLKDLETSHDIVFVNPATGNPYVDVRRAMNRALKTAGVTRPFTFHGLRHTTGSHLSMSGATEREIGEILGHKDPKMTRRYSHLAPSHMQEVIGRLDFSQESEEVQKEAQ